MSEWKTLVMLTVELVTCALVLYNSAFLNNISITSNEIQQREANTMATLAEYREYNKFDNTLIWSQDVISTILQYRGLPEVSVKYASGSNNLVNYTLTTPSSDYTNAALTDRFGVSSKFHANLEKDLNGSIVKITMVECRHPNDSLSNTSHAECK